MVHHLVFKFLIYRVFKCPVLGAFPILTTFTLAATAQLLECSTVFGKIPKSLLDKPWGCGRCRSPFLCSMFAVPPKQKKEREDEHWQKN